MTPDLANLLSEWLLDQKSIFYVKRPDAEEKAFFSNMGWIAEICHPGFGSVATIYSDHVSVSHDARDPDGFIINAADPKFLELLSNRLYILERGFRYAEQSRIETARRDERLKRYDPGH